MTKEYSSNFERWFWRMRPEPATCTAHLIILPHAGGSAQSFASWGKWLPPEVNLLATQYPGRGARFGEPAATHVDQLVDQLFEVARELNGPIFVFGHSFGGLVGFELGWRMQEAGRPLAGFFASASTPPQFFKKSLQPLPALSDAQLLKQLQDRGGMPVDVLEHPDLLEMICDVLRDDMAIINAYQLEDLSRQLVCPVMVLGGSSDSVTTPHKLAQWQARAEREIGMEFLEGGHFYFDQNVSALTEIVEKKMAVWSHFDQLRTNADRMEEARSATC